MKDIVTVSYGGRVDDEGVGSKALVGRWNCWSNVWSIEQT